MYVRLAEEGKKTLREYSNKDWQSLGATLRICACVCYCAGTFTTNENGLAFPFYAKRLKATFVSGFVNIITGYVRRNNFIRE